MSDHLGFANDVVTLLKHRCTWHPWCWAVSFCHAWHIRWTWVYDKHDAHILAAQGRSMKRARSMRCGLGEHGACAFGGICTCGCHPKD